MEIKEAVYQCNGENDDRVFQDAIDENIQSEIPTIEKVIVQSYDYLVEIN
jgi:hypothetical protein